MKKTLLLILSIFLVGCNTEDKQLQYSTPKVVSLSFLQAENPSLQADINGEINQEERTIFVSIGSDVTTTTLIPTLVVSEGASSNIGELTPMSIETNHLLKLSNHDKTSEYTIIIATAGPTSVSTIKINGTESYYNKNTDTYYAPLVRSLWGKAVTVEVVGKGITSSKIGAEKIAYGKTAEIALSLNEAHKIEIEGEEPLTVELMITGLPILVLESGLPMTDLSRNSKTKCTISLFDPEQEGTRNHHDLYGEIRVRGNSSTYYDKKSLALELHDKNTGEIIDKQFLNMRSDDDWILDAMFMEQLRMRNRVSHDIWLDMHKPHYAGKEPNALSTNRGEMAEMFYNGEYMGIYCISEKVDRKQLDVKKTGGAMYKGESWGEECILKNWWWEYTAPDDDFFGGWQIQHPTKPNNWNPLLDFLEFAIESDFNGASSTFGRGIADRVVMDNLVDFLLHLNIVNGTDNTGRNTFLSVYNTNSQTGEDSKFFYTPWDLDATFGTDWLYKKVDPNLFLGLEDVDVPSERTYGNFMLMKIAKYDIDGFGDKIKKRWAELRADKASEGKLIERFEYYYDLLDKSGAYAREDERWSNHYQQSFNVSYDPISEMEYLKSWIPQHMKYVDSYIQNWDSNTSKIVIVR